MSRHAVRILQQNRSLRCSMRPDRCSPDRVLSLPSPDPSKNSQCRLLHKWRLFHQKSATTSSWQLVAPKPVLRFRLRAECRRALQLPSFSQKSPLPRVLGRLFLLLPNRRGKGYPFLQLFAKISHFVVSTKYTLSAMCRMSS